MFIRHAQAFELFFLFLPIPVKYLLHVSFSYDYDFFYQMFLISNVIDGF